MIPPHNSLVKYDNPILVSSTKDKKGKRKTKALPPVDSKAQPTQTRDILNSILPPRCVRLRSLSYAPRHSLRPVMRQRVDGGRTAVGAVRVEHAGHATGRHQPAGAPRAERAGCAHILIKRDFRSNWTRSCSSDKLARRAFAPSVRSCMRSALVRSARTRTPACSRAPCWCRVAATRSLLTPQMS